MNLITGNLWGEIGQADLILFTANATLRDGRLIMGAGAALQAKRRFPNAPQVLGLRIREANQPCHYGIVTMKAQVKAHRFRLGAFQTKIAPRAPSTLELIERSVQKLMEHADEFTRIALNLPGCGLGNLDEKDVLPLLTPLPHHVYVYKYE